MSVPPLPKYVDVDVERLLRNPPPPIDLPVEPLVAWLLDHMDDWLLDHMDDWGWPRAPAKTGDQTLACSNLAPSCTESES